MFHVLDEDGGQITQRCFEEHLNLLDGSFKIKESQYGWVGQVLQDHRIPVWLGWKGPSRSQNPSTVEWNGTPGSTPPAKATQAPSIATGSSMDGAPTLLWEVLFYQHHNY